MSAATCLGGPQPARGSAAVRAVPPQATATAAAGAAGAPGRLKLAIVGDVHGAWRPDRELAALRLLDPDLTLLVGDFGNEDVNLVKQISELPLPKAVILGNHDAWFTMTRRHSGRRAAPAQQHQQHHSSAGRPAPEAAASNGGAANGTMAAATTAAASAVASSPEAQGKATQGKATQLHKPAPPSPSASAASTPPAPGSAAGAASDGEPLDGVSLQLAALGASHVGYGTMRLDERGYTVVGARPFSKGGRSFTSIRSFMTALYGVSSMEESAYRIAQVAQSAPEPHALIVMGHNGPTGLGARPSDICGVDWEPSAGDHGDPDLQSALAALHRSGRRVALVTFGHMHHTLHPSVSRGPAGQRRLRRMAALDPATGTVFLNAATVPRVTLAPSSPVTAAAARPPSPPLAAAGKDPLSPKSYGSGRRARVAAKAAAAAAAAAAARGGAAAAGSTAAAATATAAAARESCDAPATVHHFMVAELEYGEVVSARDVWVQVTPVADETAEAVLAAATSAAAAAEGDDGGSDDETATPPLQPRRIGHFVVQLAREHVVLRTVPGSEGGSVVKFLWNAYDQVYESYVLEGRGAYKATSTTSDGSGSGSGEGQGRPKRQQNQFARVYNTLVNYSSAASTMAETAALVANDLRTFMTSDASELPQSLRQLNKLMQASEVQETVSAVTASMVRGAATATGVASLASLATASTSGGSTPAALLDTVMEAVLSERGRGLIGMAVGVATRNATVAMCEFLERRMEAAAGAAGGLSFGPKDLLDLLASDQGERVLTVLLTNSIRTAVTSYVDATTGYNMYDDLLSSIAKSEHRDALADLMSRVTATFCREIVSAYRRAAAAAATGSGGSAPAAANHAYGASFRHAASSRESSFSGAAGGAAAAGSAFSAAVTTVSLTAAAGGGSGGATASQHPDGPSGGAASADAATTVVAKPGNAAVAVIGSGLNGRLVAGSHHKVHGGGANAGSGLAGGALSRAMLSQAPPPWLRQGGAAGGGAAGLAGGLLVLPSGPLGPKLCVLASLALALCMYALSPRTMLL
ncbi:hypothetical protein GPECTOR_60g751 [Gonium pectorale]|uniref:Calcineurin-like phosphoesterase domain-containing protein n=1 Tax=Gonium pectorale TaxID=33097 RepID=A0A150G5B0_GONPE|nr:hypothetical protein GPECTOR_60g751 [Gonium pectorale]|eukprot:KXZ44973.1 hypothetical protein GPECTOR_60g751 [Gonium pectorale]